MLDLVCLLTGYLLSKHFSVCNTDKKREKQQKKEANVPLVRWHRNCFPLFLSDRVRRKKKKKKNPCQSASHFETRKKRKERKEG